MEILQLANFGWLSVLPPIIAIILALCTKEVLSSLIIGIFAGALIYSGGNPLKMLITTAEIMSDKIAGNAYILIFLGLLGALVTLVTRAGGSAAYGEWATKKIKSRKGACLATTALGCLIFIDDYFNCLTVGTVMRPVTDRYKISRAKLAYLIDATAAPICIIAPISSWGASVASYISDAGAGRGMTTFIKIIPYNLYALGTVLMILIICSTNINFGPMAKYEKNAIEKGDLFSSKNDVTATNVQYNVGERGRVYDLIIPIASLIIFTVLSMIYTGGGFSGESIAASFGNCDSSLSLVLGSFGAIIVTFFLLVPRKVLRFNDFMASITEGVKSMVPSFNILILAWTISGICSKDYLNTGGFIGNLVSNSTFPLFILPAVIFIVAAFLGFATGTSWGTMALLIPIGAAICSPESTAHLIFPVLGAVLAGAVYGDHISPISDTTILSSTGAGCNHIDHVSTQMPYASLVTACSLVSYLLMGVIVNPWLPLLLNLVLIAVFTVVLGKRSEKKLKSI